MWALAKFLKTSRASVEAIAPIILLTLLIGAMLFRHPKVHLCAYYSVLCAGKETPLELLRIRIPS